MALYGQAGAGAADAIQQLMAMQLREMLAKEELKQRSRGLDLDQERQNRVLAMQEAEAAAAEQERQRRADRESAQDRQVNNQRGVQRMLAEGITQRSGPLTADEGRGLAALQVELGNMPDPRLMMGPEPPKQPTSLEQALVAAQSSGDQAAVTRVLDVMRRQAAATRAPSSGQSGPAEQEWVIRNGQVTPIAKGTRQAGDRPYDAVSERNQAPEGPSPYAMERGRRTIAAVDNLMGQVSNWTAGPGSLLSSVPSTDARAFAAQLKTLAANIAFNELTAMREASKTGGALGNVSNIELQLLESVLGALDPGQDPEVLKGQLQQIKESVQRWYKAQEEFGQRADPMTPAASHNQVRPMSSHGSAGGSAPKRLRFDAKGNPIP